jgi:hypothetical protein
MKTDRGRAHHRAVAMRLECGEGFRSEAVFGPDLRQRIGIDRDAGKLMLGIVIYPGEPGHPVDRDDIDDIGHLFNFPGVRFGKSVAHRRLVRHHQPRRGIRRRGDAFGDIGRYHHGAQHQRGRCHREDREYGTRSIAPDQTDAGE